MKPDLLASALFNQVDESSTTPVSIRLPNLLINELEELLIYAELSGDFPLGDSRQPTYKSLRPFDLVS